MKTIKTTDLLSGIFSYGGRGQDKKQRKFDCYGIVAEMAKRNGVELPSRETIEDKILINEALQDAKEKWCEELKEPEPYCIVAFAIHPPFVSHLGIFLEDCKRFIHSTKKRNVCIEKLSHPIWKKKLYGYFKFLGEKK